MTDQIVELKKKAGKIASEALQSGMIVGLGSGSTAFQAIRAIGRRRQNGELDDIVGIPCSEESAALAQSLGIPLGTLNEYPLIDITIDGADEIDPNLNLIKGLGGAHLREKIVAIASKQLIIIADDRKLVERLGSRAPVPVEVVAFAGKPVRDYLESLGARAVLRKQDDAVYITDEGNIIYDCYFENITDPQQLDLAIKSRPGVIEHGLFLDLATEAIVVSAAGVERRSKG